MKINSRIRNRYYFISGSIAILVICLVVYNFENKNSITGYSGHAITYSTSHPSETKPSTNNFTWKGQSNEPKFIQLPTIGANGYIEQVGIDQNHAVGVPDNIYMAAWFNASQLPGKKGLSIIDGHVMGLHGPGIFRYLDSLKSGDTFSVTLGSGKILEYKVMNNSSVPLDQVSSVLFSQDSRVNSQLNLVTCSGQFDYQTHSYNQREIVTSTLTSII